MPNNQHDQQERRLRQDEQLVQSSTQPHHQYRRQQQGSSRRQQEVGQQQQQQQSQQQQQRRPQHQLPPHITMPLPHHQQQQQRHPPTRHTSPSHGGGGSTLHTPPRNNQPSLEQTLLVEETAHVNYSRRRSPATDDNVGTAAASSPALPAMVAATPPSVDRAAGRNHVQRLQHQLLYNVSEPHYESNNKGNHSDDDDDDSGCSDSHYSDSNDRSLSELSEDWTLRSFMDHQLQQQQHEQQKQQSYCNNSPGGEKKWQQQQQQRQRSKRRLSLASAHSNNNNITNHHPAATSDDDDGACIGAYDSSLGAMIVLPSSTRRKRWILPTTLLLSLCGAIVLLSTVDIMPSSLSSLLRINRQAKGAAADDYEEHWHPLFPHSERTANVEVEVPVNPSAKPILKDPMNGGVKGGSTTTKSSSGMANGSTKEKKTVLRHLQEQDPVLGRPNNGGTDTNLGRPDISDSSSETASQGSSNTSPAPDTTNTDTSPAQDSNTPNFIQGDVVQDLCPATHTLFSQSLILRSSYGNIFSITTPDDNGGSAGTSVSKKRSGGEKLFDQDDRRDEEETAANTNDDNNNNGFFHRKLQQVDPTGNFNNNPTGDYNDIDTATDSIYSGTGVETITITTLSLRMADFRPNEDTHFEVWLYTGSGTNIELNENDMDDDPTNDNTQAIPSRGEYQSSRAKFTDWVLISEGRERELELDTAFYDHNGHIFNIGAGTTIGPLGRLDGYENMEDVTLAAQDWNEGRLRGDGGMDAITADGESTTTFFYKIPEAKFMPLKLPKYNGKLTLFVTLDRVGLQYGYAAKQEFDKVDVTKHDYISQTPSLDVLNGNVNMRMSVGEGVIFYPWMEEEFFYQTRRFLGKIWYDALIPCEYVPITEVIEIEEESDAPSASPTTDATWSPSMAPSIAPSQNGTFVAAELLVSVLIKDGPLPPMPVDVIEVFEGTLLDFVDDPLGDFCPLTWNEGATVAGQELTQSAIGGLPGALSTERRKRSNGKLEESSKREPNDGGGTGRYLRQLLEPIFYPPKKARTRLLNAITLLDVTTIVDTLYNSNSCPEKTPEELAYLIETFINTNAEELLKKLQAAHDYFADAFGVSADVVGGPVVKAMAVETEEDDNLGPIIGGIIAALVLCCFCCCLPLLVIRRRKRKESKENEIIGEDIEWARPVNADHFPPLGGYREDENTASGDGTGEGGDSSKHRKRPDGEFGEEGETPPDIGLVPVPPGLRPPPDDTEMLHSYRFLDKETPTDLKKKRQFGLPGRLPGDEDTPDPYNINIYPGGDYQQDEDGMDQNHLRHIEKTTTVPEEEDWKPDHYEPDGGVHGYDRPQKPSPDIKPSWNRLPQKEIKEPSPEKKLSIKALLLQRKADLEAKKIAMRQVEMEEAGPPAEEEDQVFAKNEPDSRIEGLMSRIKDLEKDRTTKYQRNPQFAEESDYERWKRLNIENAELSSSEESSDEEAAELVAARQRKKKKKKKQADDYMLRFDDLDAYNKALAVHQDAYIHKWVKVKVEKEGDEDEGAIIDDLAMEKNNGDGQQQVEEEEFIGDFGGDDDGDDGVEVDAQGKPKGDDANAAIKDEIRYLVSQVLPEQLADVDDLLGNFEGREEALRDTLLKKFKDSGGVIEEKDSTPPAAAAAAAPKLDRRARFAREPTEYIGDLGDEEEADPPKTDRRSLMSREKTEYIGSIRGMGDDEEDAPPPTDRRSRFSREKTEYIGSIRGMDDDEEDAPPPTDRRSGFSREKTEYIGSIRGMDDDEEDEPPPTDRRSLMSREKTEYIGSIRGMDDDEEDAPPPTDRRSTFSREKTEYIGSIRGMDDDGEDAPPSTDRRSGFSREKTEYIGSIRGMDDDEEEGTSSGAQVADRRSRFSREKTEYIGDLGNINEEDSE